MKNDQESTVECEKSNNEIKTEPSKSAKPNKRPACQFCGRPSTRVMFAAYVCDSEECLNQAMEQRGGPAGHKKNPKEWMK